MAPRFSLGDENKVRVRLTIISLKVHVRLIDELPEQFQESNFQEDQS